MAKHFVINISFCMFIWDRTIRTKEKLCLRLQWWRFRPPHVSARKQAHTQRPLYALTHTEQKILEGDGYANCLCVVIAHRKALWIILSLTNIYNYYQLRTGHFKRLFFQRSHLDGCTQCVTLRFPRAKKNNNFKN